MISLFNGTITGVLSDFLRQYIWTVCTLCKTVDTWYIQQVLLIHHQLLLLLTPADIYKYVIHIVSVLQCIYRTIYTSYLLFDVWVIIPRTVSIWVLVKKNKSITTRGCPEHVQTPGYSCTAWIQLSLLFLIKSFMFISP